MAKGKVTDTVRDLLEDFMHEEGYEIYDIEFAKEGTDWFLKVYADLDEEHSRTDTGEDKYIGTEDCEKISRYLSEKLDSLDPIKQNYILIVSSPGMDRPLITPQHYKKYIGKDVEIGLYKGIDGVKHIDGVLEAFDDSDDDNIITVRDHDGRQWRLRLSMISKANLAVVF